MFLTFNTENMGNSINRIIWIDLIKCLAIFLVILGHIITSFNHNYLNSPLYLSIYSFHMPLFMMISGYMISIKHLNNPLKYLKKRVYSILFPALIWGAIVIGIRILLGVHIQHGFMHQWWWGLWFLKSLFACNIIILLSHLFTKKHIYIAIIAIIISQLTLLIPHLHFLQLHKLLPCMAIGMILNKYQKYILPYSKYLGLFFGLCFVCLSFRLSSNILYPHIDLITTPDGLNIYGDCLYSFLIGISGTLAITFIFYQLFKNAKQSNAITTVLSVIGQHTLQIYIIQTIVLETIFAHYFQESISIETLLSQMVVAPFLSIIILVICFYPSLLVDKAGLSWYFNFNKMPYLKGHA